MKKPLILIIMDGFGLAPEAASNAVFLAKTPELDRLFASYPHTELAASGEAVGLPDGQIGNSEVGHTSIGSGRIVYQELPRITKSIFNGDFFENEALLGAVANCKKHGSALHLFGLLSDGGVHSHKNHAFALLELAKRAGLQRVYMHCFLDGRDVPPKSGLEFVAEAVRQCERTGAKIATVMGRYYAMDRDMQWNRVKLAYDAITEGAGEFDPSPVAAVQKSYDAGITDEFMLPVVTEKDARLRENDSVIFYNFRPDRARELTRALVDPDFTGFERQRGFFPLTYVCMTEYDVAMPNVSVAFSPKSLHGTFGEYISAHGLTQLRISETTKYAHVTFFFNGGEETVFPGEARVLIPTPDVATFDLNPEMSAFEVCSEVCSHIRLGVYDVVILNYANCDMVGHTGILPAAIKAVEAVDTCVGETVRAAIEMGGAAIVTADHGNADCMLGDDGITPLTAHSLSPVPFIIAGIGNVKLKPGRLCDIAPTMLDIMGLEKTPEMTGESLIIK